MATPSQLDLYTQEDRLKSPCQFVSSSLIEDSGYLSQGVCSPFNETRSIDLGSTNNGSLQATDSLCSITCDDAILSPVNSMEVDDSSVERDFLKPQPTVFLKPSESLLEVWQSTPAGTKVCKNVHKEFDFVTPLPGPSCNSSSRIPSLHGQQHVDILLRLAQQRVLPPLHQILSYLDPVDLCQLRLVSSSWRKLLNTFPQVKVWQQFVKVRQQNKENSMLNAAKPEEGQELLVTPVSSRGQLRDINNFVLVPVKQSNHSPPVSPSKLHSSRYIKEGQKLKSGEKLRKCPKCAWPSRLDKNKIGVRCTGRFCGFYFCMDCSGPFHENTPCAKTTPVTPTKARNRVNKVGYKKRLHRLLL